MSFVWVLRLLSEVVYSLSRGLYGQSELIGSVISADMLHHSL